MIQATRTCALARQRVFEPLPCRVAVAIFALLAILGPGPGMLQASAAPHPSRPRGPTASASAAPKPSRQRLGKGRDRLDIVFGAADNPRSLIYLHGLCGNPLAFSSWARAAAKHGTLIALRGDIPCRRRRGRFRWSLDGKSHKRRIEAAIRRVNVLRTQRQERQLQLKDVALIGYSQGARRVEWLAAQFPKQFRRVAIIATAKEPAARRLGGCESVLFMAGALDAKQHIKRAAIKLQKAGIRTTYLELPGARHGSYGPKAQATMAAGLEWLFANRKTDASNSKRPGLSKKNAVSVCSPATRELQELPAGEISVSNVHDQIDQLIKDNDVVLFMKGTRMFPQCGFSQRAVGLLKRCGAKFKDVNVLADPAIRQGIKEYSNWPTIPQCYIKGEFVGGSDILVEMYESGELQTTLGMEPEPEATEAPTIEVSESAQKAFAAALQDVDGEVLRFDVSKDFDYDLYFGKKRDGDFEVQAGSLTLFVSKTSATRASGTRIDFVDGADGTGFKIDNPNEPAKVSELGCAELAAKLKAGESIHVFDVRGDRERETASLDFALPLDDAGLAKIAELPKDAMIVFHCHHGIRSRNAAQKFLAEGYTNLHNLRGGIDAWSLAVDSSVPRY